MSYLDGRLAAYLHTIVSMKAIWGTRRGQETEEDRQVDRLTRRESPDQRARRIRAKQVDPATVAALRRLWAA